MLIPNQDFVRAFKKAKAVREHVKLYQIGGDSYSLSVDTLKATVEQMYGLKIELYEVVATAMRVEGMVERYADGRAEGSRLPHQRGRLPERRRLRAVG